MQVKKNELQTILEGLRPGLAKRDIVETLSNFTFSNNRICTFNDQISINHPFECDFECSVDGQNFYSIVVNSPGETVDLVMDGVDLIVSTKESKAVLKTVEVANILSKIQLPEVKAPGWKILPEDFLKGIKLCSFSVSKDLTRPSLTCVAALKDKILSSDGLRISKFNLSKEMRDDFLIPGTSASILVSYPVKRYVKSDSWVHFKTDSDVVFSSRTVLDEFPEVNDYFKVEEVVSFNLPKGLKEIVDSVAIITDQEFAVDRVIKISFLKKDKKIVCSGYGSLGSFERFCPFKEGENVQRNVFFDINPYFFSEILNNGSKMTLGEKYALFSEGNFEHVMCLPTKKSEENSK